MVSSFHLISDFPLFIPVCILVPSSVHLIIFFSFLACHSSVSALTLLVVFLPNHLVLLRVGGVMCMCFIFFLDVVLQRLMGFGSLLQCAAIVELCDSPLPFAKLFRHTLFPFSFCIVPARLPSTCLSYIRCLYNSSYLFIMHAPFPGIRHLFLYRSLLPVFPFSLCPTAFPCCSYLSSLLSSH